MLETAIKDALSADAGITDAVADRVRPLGVALDDVRPYLTYQVTSRQPITTLADGPAAYRKAEFEVMVVADTYVGAMDLSHAVRERFADYGGIVANVELDTLFEDETDVEEAPAEGDESPAAYVRRLTFRALYRDLPQTP